MLQSPDKTNQSNSSASPPEEERPLDTGGRAARINSIFADYLTQQEMAGAAGVSTRTLSRWHSLRLGPPRTVIGRKILYHIPAAKAWLAAQQEEVAKRGARK